MKPLLRSASQTRSCASTRIKSRPLTRACLPMIWGVGGDDRAYDACGSDFG